MKGSKQRETEANSGRHIWATLSNQINHKIYNGGHLLKSKEYKRCMDVSQEGNK